MGAEPVLEATSSGVFRLFCREVNDPLPVSTDILPTAGPGVEPTALRQRSCQPKSCTTGRDEEPTFSTLHNKPATQPLEK